MKNFSHPLCLASCNQTRRFLYPKQNIQTRHKNQTKQPKTQTKTNRAPAQRNSVRNLTEMCKLGNGAPAQRISVRNSTEMCKLGKQGPNKEKCPSISTKTCPSKVFKNNYIFMYRNGSYQSSRALIDFFVGKSRTLLSVNTKPHIN